MGIVKIEREISLKIFASLLIQSVIQRDLSLRILETALGTFLVVPRINAV